MTRLSLLALLLLGGCSRAIDGRPVDEVDDDGVTDDPSDPGDDQTGDPTGDECPAGVTCVTAFPWTGSGNTIGRPSVLDGYSCSPGTDESGPEDLYRIELAEDGFVTLSLDGLPQGVDVDVHLLEDRDASTCIDRGHWTAGAWLPAGRYWVVVDSWVSSGTSHEGAYELTIGHNTVSALAAMGIDEEMASAALYAFDVAWFAGETDRFTYALIDFSLPSYEERLWVLDLTDTNLLYHELVSHGEASSAPNDPARAVTFSNIDGSHQSSLGVLVTAETYSGSKGYSMRLDGLEPGVNDNVRSRAIVMHPATYATQDFVDTYGYLGRSWGCPAVDPAVSEEIIDTLSDGSLVLAWYPDEGWLGQSSFLAGWEY